MTNEEFEAVVFAVCMRLDSCPGRGGAAAEMESRDHRDSR